MSVATVGLDIAKQFFQVHGVDASGGWVTLSRETFRGGLPFRVLKGWAVLRAALRFSLFALLDLE